MDVITLFLNKNIDVNARQYVSEDTALICASAKGRTEATQFLLTHPNIDVNAKDKQGWSALTIASDWNHTKIVELLLSDPRLDLALHHQ